MKTPLIVLIEDNDGDALLVEKALVESKIAHRLERFTCGLDAVEALCAPRPPMRPDLILLDLNTPRSDGFEVLDRMRGVEYLARVPVAILTSSRSRHDKQRAVERGARFIEKPSRLLDFFSAIRTAVTEMLGPPPGVS